MQNEATVGGAVNDLTARFAAAGIDSPRLDARILIGHALGLEPSLLFARADQVLTPADTARIAALCERRLTREPVSRIVGIRAFWGLDFVITPDTLDPRPDTETVVAGALALKDRYGDRPVRILDLGSGSGCILLALLSEWPQARGLGIDLNPHAVAAARANADRLKLADRATFAVGAWCEGLSERFDIIVSNPPYIADDEFADLAPEVAAFDPHLALAGGADGLTAYRAMIPQAHERLLPAGHLLLEFGSTQSEAVGSLLSANGFRIEAELRDLAGNMRCLLASRGNL